MIKHEVTIFEAVDLLNAALKLDRDAMEALVETRVPCNAAFVGHPTLQVQLGQEGGPDSSATVGLLGILNGIFGADAEGWGAILAHYDEYRLTAFSVTKERLPQ